MTTEEGYYLSCGILQKWHTKSFKQYTNDDVALEKIQSYLSKHEKFRAEGVGIFLYGANGTGKSHLLNCAFKELIKLRYKVRITSFSSLISSFIQGWYETDRESVIRDLKRADFLAIEELGKEFKSKESELAKTVLDNILRYRIQMNKPTWITSNNKPSDLESAYSVDISSMLKESCIPLQVTGKDYRDVIKNKLKNEL